MDHHGEVEHGFETALDANVRRTTDTGPWVDHVDWLRHQQAAQILEMLEAWCRRMLVKII